MALNAFLSLKSVKQGTIKGSVVQKGREGLIAVFEYRHQVSTPRDASSGLPVGKRQHTPLIITKEIDQSTPKLMTALIANERFSECILKFFTPENAARTGVGTEVQHYTIRLTNASIVSIDQDMEMNKTEPGKTLPLLETIAFTYEKIEWTFVQGNIMASDDWSA